MTQLFKKYNVPGPRYTSYPTVPYWDTSPTESQWIEHISQSLDQAHQQDVGSALYIHIPFCQSLCTYCGCNTRITRNHEVGKPYIQTLIRELDLYLDKLGKKTLPVSEIHLGGGTPTFLTPQELGSLIEQILARSTLLSDREFSLEADPRVTTQDHLSVLSQLGFTRLSLGIQDFDPRVQDIVHRIQSKDQVRAVTDTARELGFDSVNYDLIYGLPLQTLESVRGTIQAVQELRPDRIAFYAYAHVPWIKPGQRRFTEADLPSGDEKRALYELGRKMLEDVGYQEIGMDHFALKSDSLWKSSQNHHLHRNFMGYTSRQVSPLIGLGVSAIGDSWTAFMQNEKLLEKYQERVQAGQIPILRGHILGPEDQVIRRHILNLMTRFETKWDKESGLYTQYLDQVPARLAELVTDGLVRVETNACQVTDLGRPFLRNICMAFDARLTRQAPATQLFSQTI